MLSIRLIGGELIVECMGEMVLYSSRLNRKHTLVELNVFGPLNYARQLAIGTGLNLRHGDPAYRLILRFKLN